MLEFALPILLATALAGCATTPRPDTAIDQAEAALQSAQSNPDTVANAPVSLYEARQALDQAKQAENAEEAAHLAYISEKKSQLAAEISQTKIARDKLTLLGQEREQILIKAREAETAQARLDAEMSLQLARQEREKALRAEEDAQRLQKELEELKAKPTDRGYVLTLGDILFEFGKAQLLPGAMNSIYRLGEFLKKHPERNVLVEGYTDSIGSAEYNLGLSQRRAYSVKDALLRNGIESGRIIAKGYGKNYPVAGNDTDAGRQQNRRVEVVILEEGQDPAQLLRR
jgi:outer membrane protein OmpA-like peptidoglycan-associated protein